MKIKHNFSLLLPSIKMLQGANVDLKDAKKTDEDLMAKFKGMSSDVEVGFIRNGKRLSKRTLA